MVHRDVASGVIEKMIGERMFEKNNDLVCWSGNFSQREIKISEVNVGNSP